MGLLSAIARAAKEIGGRVLTDGVNVLGTVTNPIYVSQSADTIANGAVTKAKIGASAVDGTKIDAAIFQRFLVISAQDASGGAQADTATGAKVGDKVQSVLDLTDLTDVTADFESVITIADQIQQLAANLAAKKCLVILLAQS